MLKLMGKKNIHSFTLKYYVYLKHCIYINFFVIGMFAIRAERDYVIDEDFMKAVRKVADNKKLESKLDYKPV